METLQSIPVWLQCLLAAVTAVGGFEAIKYLINIKSNKKKEGAGATQAMAEAKMAEVECRKAELESYRKTIEFSEEKVGNLQNDYRALTEENKDLKKEVRTLREFIEHKEAEQGVLLAQIARKVVGMQNVLTIVIAQKQAAENNYCSREDCDKRQPPKGEYYTPVPQIPQIDIPIDIVKKGAEEGVLQ